ALKAKNGAVGGNKKPPSRSWMRFAVGRGGFYLDAVLVRTKQQIRAELYIAGGRAKVYFGLLEAQRDAIEREVGYALNWEELTGRHDCRISCVLSESDPENEADWPRQHEWLAARLNDLHSAFAPRIASLDADARQAPE